MDVPVCVPVILMVLLQMLLFNTTGEPGPPRELMAVTACVPVRPVKVMLFPEMVSATSEGVPEVSVKQDVPEADALSMFAVLFLMFTKARTVAS